MSVTIEHSLRRMAENSVYDDIVSAEKDAANHALSYVRFYEKPCHLTVNLGFGSPDLPEDEWAEWRM